MILRYMYLKVYKDFFSLQGISKIIRIFKKVWVLQHKQQKEQKQRGINKNDLNLIVFGKCNNAYEYVYGSGCGRECVWV